ncbi:MAG: hypothetical protein ACOY95_05720 [Pseudomonadota bacterium]
MPIPWLTVLQAVPWGEVIRNAPKVAEGARTLWNKAAGPATSAPPGPASAAPPTLAQLQDRLQASEAALAEVQAQMQSATQLIKELADQNTQLVRAIETQRRQLRWLAGVAVLLIVGGVLVGLRLLAG